MAFPFTALAFAAQLVAAADVVPNIDYEKGCRGATAADASLGIVADNQRLSSCMAEEKAARDKLAQQWTQFPAGDRTHCEQEAALGEMPSYVELSVCLEMARETKSLPEYKNFAKSRSGR